MLDSLLGSGNTFLKFFIAFAIVIALIGITAWLVRRFGANRLGGAGTRGRQPRLAVIDAASVDGRRRLLLIRRDNIEHLLMIGGPSDIVIEPNIVRAVGAREIAREPMRVTVGGDALTRQGSSADSAWPLQPANEPPAPVTAQRPYRATVAEESWTAPEPVRQRPVPSDSLTGLAAELSSRLNPPEAPAPARADTTRVNGPAPSEAPQQPQQTDHNLAEMAQQLEAALRRAPAAENRPPVTDPLAAPAFAAPTKPPRARNEPRIEPQLDTRVEPRLDTRPNDPRSGKALYDNLEQEMASLLGRPSGKN